MVEVDFNAKAYWLTLQARVTTTGDFVLQYSGPCPREGTPTHWPPPRGVVVSLFTFVVGLGGQAWRWKKERHGSSKEAGARSTPPNTESTFLVAFGARRAPPASKIHSPMVVCLLLLLLLMLASDSPLAARTRTGVCGDLGVWYQKGDLVVSGGTCTSLLSS